MDKHDAIHALSLLAQSATDALAALASPAPAPAPTSAPAPLHLVLADIDAFFARIDALSTKLSLALKPTAPAYSASSPLLRDLAQHTLALAHAVCLLHNATHGAALVKHVKSHVSDIIDALRALAQTFLNNAARGPQLPDTTPASEEYLLRTGTLHDLIASSQNPSGLPKDNRTAVLLSWKSDRESLEDNLHEITRMIKDAESDHTHDDPADEFDDGWDELELGPTTRMMDKDELSRAKNVHQLLRLTTLLHKRIFLDLLAYPSSAPPSAFDTLLTQSNLLLSTSDDLVAALYAPQEPDQVRDQVLQLAQIATSLQTQIHVHLPVTEDLAKQLHALNVDDCTPAAMSSSPPKKRADKKWFDTCVHQIIGLCTSIDKSTNQTNKPNMS